MKLSLVIFLFFLTLRLFAADFSIPDSTQVILPEADSTKIITPDSLLQEETVQKLSPDTIEKRIKLARKLAREYKFDRATDTLEVLFQQDTTSVEVMCGLEELYYTTSQVSSALNMVNRLLEAGKDSSVYMAHKALLLKKEGDIAQSLELFLHLLEKDSTNTFFLNKSAEIFAEFQMTDSAMTYYTKSVNISAKSNTIYKATQLLLGEDRRQETMDFFDQYYNPNVHTEKILRRLYGQTFYLLDEIQPALDVFSDLYQEGDSSFITTKFLGMSYRKNGDFVQGEEVLKQAIKRNRNDFLVFYNLGICCRKIGLVDESEKHFNTAMEIMTTPVHVKNLINRELAITYEKQMKWKKAVALYQSILETNPSDFAIRMSILSIVDYQLKDRDLAILKYNEALKMLAKNSMDAHTRTQLEKYFTRRLEELEKEEFWSAESD